MKSLLVAVFLLASALATTPVSARTPVPVINHDNVVVATATGKTLAAEQVKQAILAAVGVKGWSAVQQADGKLLATLHVRGKHTVVVEITYAADKYSLIYKDSVNMKSGSRDGQTVIHPFYNKWVQELLDAIRLELLKA